MLIIKDWQRIQTLFHGAVELPPAEQASFLEANCQGDSQLLRQVRSLLVAMTDDGLESAVADVAAKISGPTGPEPGDRLGAWVVERLLGEGGMGRVYLAERADDEYRKKAAIKVVSREISSPAMLARFRNERQILASLEHPNIARMLEGGTTSGGSPFVVMEYIEGVAITAHCREKASSVEQRLDLFRQVCNAVQYAHQNLVIHRDIKPGNILVDPGGVPKLLDFGIAKLLAPDVPHGSPGLTRAAERILTPEYASPEQWEGAPVSTASDIYSLGVLLYELLSDAPMHAPGLRRTAAPVVRKPSDVAPRDRRRQLIGDLDNIVRKATAQEPAQRYATAAQFADDIERYLAGFPVLAQPDRWSYRAGKFVARHKAAVALGLVFLLSIIGFATGMGILARQARRESENAKAVSSFLVDIFRVADPAESRGRAITATEILDRGALRVRKEMQQRPEVQATLMQAIGEVYMAQGLLDKAGPLLTDVLRIREKISGADSLEVAAILASLAEYYDSRSDYATSQQVLQRLLAIREKRLPPGAQALGEAWSDIGLNHYYQARYREASAAHTKALAIFRKVSDEKGIESSLNNLAIAELELGEYRSAVDTHTEIIRRRTARIGETHPTTLISMSNLTYALEMLGEYRQRCEVSSRMLAIRRKVLGENHPFTAQAWTNFAFCRRSLGDQAEFVKALTHALEIRKGRLDGDDVEMAMNKFALADALAEEGALPRAQELANEAFASLQKRPMPTRLAQCQKILGKIAWIAGQRELAEQRFRESISGWSKLPGRARLGHAEVLMTRGEFYWAAGRMDEAEKDFRESLELRLSLLPQDHPQVGFARAELGNILSVKGNTGQGVPLLKTAVEILTQRFGSEHFETALAQHWLAHWSGKPDLLKIPDQYLKNSRVRMLAGSAGTKSP